MCSKDQCKNVSLKCIYDIVLQKKLFTLKVKQIIVKHKCSGASNNNISWNQVQGIMRKKLLPSPFPL